MAKILARAEEIRDGALLKFGRSELEAALDAFVKMWWLRWKCHGEPFSYLQLHGVTTVYGLPDCYRCRQTFANNGSYARHMLGYKHQIKKTTREAVDEVRAHLQAFAMPDGLFANRDRSVTVREYEFRNVPGEGDEEPSVESPEPAPADARDSATMESL